MIQLSNLQKSNFTTRMKTAQRHNPNIFKAAVLCLCAGLLADAVLAQSSTSFGYSPQGNLLGATSLRESVVFQWDALGRNNAKLVNGDSYLFGYNGQGFLFSYTDPKGLNTQYTYNGFGFLTSLTSPDTGYTSFSNNLAGATTQKATSGSVTNITYDAEDRVSSKTVSHPTLGSLTYSYAYGGPGSGYSTGNLTSISVTGLSIGFEYNAFSNITKKTQAVTGSATLVTQYSYSSPNAISSIGYPSGRVATYSRNAAGQIVGISVDGNTVVSNITYSPYGVSGWTFGNGNTVVRTFDLQGRITSVTLATGTRAYAYDNRDNLVAISDPVLGNATYSYDYQNRLSSANTALGQWSYTYDANGSRTQLGINGSGYAVIVDSASNRTFGYSTPTVRSLNYNNQGHVAQITGDPATPACGSNTQAAYNANGSLTSSNLFDAVYDDFGFRLRKSASACAGGAVTLFDYGMNGFIQGEYTNEGEPIQETVWLGDIPVAVFRGIKNSEPPYFIYTDNLNTPRQIMNNSSQLVWSWDGEPFGATPANENVSPTTTFTYNLRFPGQYYDKESGLHQNRWREYDPKQGKYLQSDPLGLAAGVNTYAYVGSSPLMFIDPLGLDCVGDQISFSCTVPFGGPSFGPLPTPVGFSGNIVAGTKNYHYYAKSTNFSNCDPVVVRNSLINKPTPWLSYPASSGGTNNNATPRLLQALLDSNGPPGPRMPNPLNPVKSYLTKDRNTGEILIVNVTQPGHQLFPGYTVRKVSGSSIITYGEGLGYFQSQEFPELARNSINNVWYDEQESMASECGCNVKK